MAKKFIFQLLVSLLLVLVFLGFAEAQQTAKISRLGFLSGQSASRSADRADAFRQGLRELGYVEGKNIVIEYRWANGINDRLPDLAAELVPLKVDVIVTSGGPHQMTLDNGHGAQAWALAEVVVYSLVSGRSYQGRG